MTWRPTKYLLEGELDNTMPGKVTGWMRFAGMKREVTFDLQGDFHEDIEGTKISLAGKYDGGDAEAAKYMDGFAEHQSGKVENITAGLPPQPYTDYPYIEWISDANDRVVVQPEADQVKVIGPRVSAKESHPVCRRRQNPSRADATGQRAKGSKPFAPPQGEASKGHTVLGMRLLTEKIRRQLPPLYAQDGKGGQAVAYVKFFTPDSSWSWFVTEFSPEEELFFGLVDGMERELGYFSLAELESARGPMGLPIERDVHWQPQKLEELAPEMFRKTCSDRRRS